MNWTLEDRYSNIRWTINDDALLIEDNGVAHGSQVSLSIPYANIIEIENVTVKPIQKLLIRFVANESEQMFKTLIYFDADERKAAEAYRYIRQKKSSIPLQY